MQALMQDWSLTLDKILDHAARWHGDREVVTRSVEGPVTRSTYADLHRRAKQVSHGLLAMGIKPGDRVATMGWNSDRHLEVWYGCIGIGAVLHTLNPRLFPEQIIYIANHAQDTVLFADPACAPLLAELLPQCPTIKRVVFMSDEAPPTPFPAEAYEPWLSGRPADTAWGGFDETLAAGLCYTSGTTGNPKGVLYGHRSNYLHAMMTLQPDALNLSARDTVLLIVPMYHANAWGVMYSAPMVGAKLVLPGAKLDGASLHELMETEGVTYSAGVPTIWQMLLTHLKDTGGKLTTLRRVTVGGAACPESLIRALRDDYDVDVIQGWGMTETSPLATVSIPSPKVAALPFESQLPYKLKQGRLVCNLDLKLVDDAGQRLPHDGKTFGKLMIKGPTVASAYYGSEPGSALDEEGFFDTGDVSTIDADGWMQITDRAKDVIKSGGEWISSIDVENIAVGHPKAALCAVLGVVHPKWDERPILLVQLEPGQTAEKQEFLDYLDGKIARWWTPDDVLFVDEIPLGPTGKIDKKLLRTRLTGYELPFDPGLKR
ncbi:MAG: long-chain-fatty-acid--CoA ligase [Alphaproteobacteria bacterium]|nr:long-chain-fatty-acid--CoA ligase [Alphaproteobacteria bacterium]MBU1516088.1 long-chain-fatty-acid--CoA ligase [Alphaproteobacteria bacterium]MBU2092697.1 long-chain-fatty-acid--CoA ligase [Alphaproteobacteria bacterium]MBU2153778.1 long-chain-fatty-acid--CoA ligase [Alphaproteobacteria bacterium]MBU2308406.1 long-chain-fatty-acid--CoA ligase [Alphaproteobacteria bacterium]